MLTALLSAGALEGLIYRAIRRQAVHDEARLAGAVVVLGAAEYNGSPSPVYKARLDHTFDLEERGLARLIITTGGSGGDPRFTEAGVARDYLVQRGVAPEKILADTGSGTSYESLQAAAALLKQEHAADCIVVSDGFHLYRVKRILAAEGVTAYGSPAPGSPIEADPIQRTLFSLREMLSMTLWYLGYKG